MPYSIPMTKLYINQLIDKYTNQRTGFHINEILVSNYINWYCKICNEKNEDLMIINRMVLL